MRITRRDFVNGTLAGAGASLLGMPAPARAQGLGDAWTGFGGIGDYAVSNGNTAAVVNAAHAIRDGRFPDPFAMAAPLDETYDLVVVGGGFAGLAAAYQFRKAAPGRTILLLDNHPVPGGEAKQNVVEIDGVTLIGPQGSNGTLVPTPGFYPIANEYWAAFGIPRSFEFAKDGPNTPTIKFARENYESMFWDEGLADTGWFFGSTMLRDPFADRLARVPLPERTKRDWLAWHDWKTPVAAPAGRDPDRWLDTMTYGQYLTGVMGLHDDIFALVDPLVAAGDYGVSATAISAYAAKLLGLPGPAGASGIGYNEADVFSFPGGNTTIARYLFKALMPDAIQGSHDFADVAGAPFDFSAFDRPGTPLRVRTSATAVGVAHAGDPQRAPYVNVAYTDRTGALLAVRARSVVMAGGGWVNKHVVRDLPPEIATAYAQFHNGAILVVNVGLRNWRAMADLGISALRWFDGLGFFANVRRPMVYRGYHPPLEPDKPAMLTMYVGFPQAGVPLQEQAVAGRVRLFSTSYAQFEAQIRDRLQSLLGPAGFDHRRDIGAIVLNRWGHAYIAPQPGFYFGPGGGPGPAAVVQRGFGRISFGHSELQGRQNWPRACEEGKRAALQAAAHVV
ncbi:MAG TPA: NAD(P)-binding protein [Candidatus Tumulicola sp.]|nr:NAD(P)-binding protein [Candidatus Tumulicola sp.]